MCMTVRQSE